MSDRWTTTDLRNVQPAQRALQGRRSLRGTSVVAVRDGVDGRYRWRLAVFDDEQTTVLTMVMIVDWKMD
jgi:hypothetical protein